MRRMQETATATTAHNSSIWDLAIALGGLQEMAAAVGVLQLQAIAADPVTRGWMLRLLPSWPFVVVTSGTCTARASVLADSSVLLQRCCHISKALSLSKQQ